MTALSLLQPAEKIGFVPGSDEHRDAFCRMLLDTHDLYNPAMIEWPQLDAETLARLTRLPFWDVAVQTEGFAAARVMSLANILKDPVLQEAVALDAFEEGRHKLVLEHMLRFYNIRLSPEPEYKIEDDPEWCFLRTGYGECFDSFFAFGLFELARRSGFFPKELVSVFEPVVREEGRHILFFVNWVAYTAATKPLFSRLRFYARCFMALLASALGRVSMARGLAGGTKRKKSAPAKETPVGKGTFVVAGGQNLAAKFELREFLQLCLAENDRRLAPYDQRLRRPTLMPTLVKMALFFIR